MRAWRPLSRSSSLVLRRHLLVGRQQNDVVEPPARLPKPVPVLEEVGVHDEGLAGAGGALESDGAKVVRGVVRQPLGQRILAFRLVEIGAEALRIGEVAVQVVFGEEEREVLVGLPRPAVLPGHAEPYAQRGDVGVVRAELLRRHLGAGGVPVEAEHRGVLALPARVEAGGQIA